jgi:hypothetical protein
MALKKFNSQSGYSVGLEPTIAVVDSNGNVIANTLEVTNFANLGSISNISILGGNPDQVVATDGSGTLFFKDAALTLPGGSNQSIQFNNDGVFGGDANLLYNNTTGALTATSFTGNGIGISYIEGANVFGEVANANYAHYALVTLNSTQSNTSTTVIGNYQPNITQVGSLANLTVTGALIANSSLIVGGDATITGNLIVEGNAIYADVETLRIENPIMQLGSNPTGGVLTEADEYNARGTLMHYFTTNAVDAFVGWDDTNQEFSVASNVSLVANTLIIHEYGNLKANYFVGDGSRISNIFGSNVTGFVPNAVYANTATTSGVANTVNDSAQPNIRSFGTLTSLAVSPAVNPSLGNVATANFFVGNGYRLFNITGGNVIGEVPNATYAVSAGSSLLAEHVTAADQPNITSLGTLTSLTVDGPITSQSASLGDSVTATHIIGEGGNLSNITGSNVFGKVANAIFSDNAGLAEYVTQGTQSNITGVGTLTSLTVTGLVTSGSANLGDAVRGNFFIGDGSNLANINGANVTGKVANAIFSDNAENANYANFAGNVVIGDQPNITNVGLLTLLNISGNLTAGNATLGNIAVANFFSGNATYLANIQGANVVGNVNLAKQANTANFANISNTALRAGTVTTNYQPNITSVGTLTDLLVSGNISVSNISASDTITGTYLAGDGYQIANINGANIESDVANANYANFAGSSLTADSAYIANLVYNNVQPNINEIGILNFLTVNGPTVLDTFTANSGIVSGMLTVGNVAGEAAGLYNIYGPNVTNKVANAVFSDNAEQANVANYAVHITESNQPNITNVGTLVDLDVSGGVTFGQNLTVTGLVLSDYLSGDGSNISNITGGNVTGSVANAVYADEAGHSINSDHALLADVANTVSDNAQPNITSLGTLNSLTLVGEQSVTGNVVVSGNITANNFISTNMSGVFSGDVTIVGANGAVLFNDAGYLKSANFLLFNKTSNTLTVPGNLNVSNNITRDGKSVPTFVTQATAPTNPKLGDQWLDTDTTKVYQYFRDPQNLSYAWVDISTGFINSNTQASGGTLVLRDPQGNISSNNLSVTGDASITGNLDVKGSVTYIQSTVTYVTDPITEIGGGEDGNPLISNNNMDRGTLIHNFTTVPVDAFIGWDTSNAEFALANNVSVTDNVVTFNDYGNLRIGNLTVIGSITSSTGGALVVGNAIPLGIPLDADLVSPGSITSWTTETKVTDAIDDLNEALENVRNNTYVKSVSFTGTPTAGGAGTLVTLTITSVGNPNRYDINWGDGTYSNNTSSTTPTHTYATNVDSPFDVTVRAYNNGGSGKGSEASFTRADYIVIYTANPVVSFSLYKGITGGSALSGTSLYVSEGETFYLDNTTTNTSGATVTYTINWGDSSTPDTISSDSVAGGVGGGRISHIYATGQNSGTGTKTITLTLNSHNTATPAYIATGPNSTSAIKIYNPSITAPNGLSSKTTVAFQTSVGTSPYLAANFANNTGGAVTITAGSSVSRVTTVTPVETIVLSTYAYNGDSGYLRAFVNGSEEGNITLATGSQVGTNSSLVLSAESDYNLLDANGTSIAFSASIYSPALYKGFTAKVSKTNSALTVGVNNFKLSHTATGNTNIVEFVKDDVTSVPTVDVSVATISNATNGTYRYVSGIPYYNTGSPTITMTGANIYNWIGQTYRNTTTPFQIEAGTNDESTTGNVIATQTKTYANLDGATTFLSSSIPKANTGNTISNQYTIGSQTITVAGVASVAAVQTIKFLAVNVNGSSAYATHTKKIQVFTATPSGFVEDNITCTIPIGAVANSNAAKRIVIASAIGDTPAYVTATNYYTSGLWSGAQTVAGTDEAIVRFNQLKNFATDLSTGYLPAGPDLSTGRGGTQYFRGAFVRASKSSFNITITGKISGLRFAVPGVTDSLPYATNGWLNANQPYFGAGVAGANDSGCADGSVVPTGSVISGATYKITFGEGSTSSPGNSGNQVLFSIALASGDYITSWSFS